MIDGCRLDRTMCDGNFNDKVLTAGSRKSGYEHAGQVCVLVNVL